MRLKTRFKNQKRWWHKIKRFYQIIAVRWLLKNKFLFCHSIEFFFIEFNVRAPVYAFVWYMDPLRRQHTQSFMGIQQKEWKEDGTQRYISKLVFIERQRIPSARAKVYVSQFYNKLLTMNRLFFFYFYHYLCILSTLVRKTLLLNPRIYPLLFIVFFFCSKKKISSSDFYWVEKNVWLMNLDNNNVRSIVYI